MHKSINNARLSRSPSKKTLNSHNC